MENRTYFPQNKLACSIVNDGKFKLFESRTMLSFTFGVRAPYFWFQFIYDFVQPFPGLGDEFNLGEVNVNALQQLCVSPKPEEMVCR